MSESKFPVSVVIGAVDNVTYKVMEINQKLEKITQPLGKLKTAFGDLGRESGLNKLGSAIGNVGTKGAALFGDLKGAALGLAGVLATVGLAINKLVFGAAASGDAIRDSALRIGISTDAFQKYQFAATQSGIAAEKVEGILTKFSKTIGDANLGTGEGIHIFRGLGISLKDASGKARSMEQILPELADKFKKISDPAMRNAILMRLFGREGAKMGELLSGGSEGIARLGAEAERLGLIIGEDKINQADRFNDAWGKLSLSIGRARDAFGAELFPIMTELFDKLSSFLAENRPQIIAFAQAFAQELPGVLITVRDLIVGLWRAIQPLVTAFKTLSSIFGTANVVMATFGAIIGGKLFISLVGFVQALWQLGGAVMPVVVRMFGLMVPLLKIVWGLLMANPIGAAIAALAALVAIGVTLYKNWEPFRNLIDGLWNKLKGIGGAIKSVFGFDDPAAKSGGTQLGKPLGGATTAQNATSLNKTENQIVVSFDNMPKGTRVQTDKAEAPVDLTLGYSMAGGL